MSLRRRSPYTGVEEPVLALASTLALGAYFILAAAGVLLVLRLERELSCLRQSIHDWN